MGNNWRHLFAGGLPLPVVRGDRLGVGHVERNAPGHSQHVDPDVWVGGDDGTGREVNSLAHQVPTHPPLLGLQPLAD